METLNLILIDSARSDISLRYGRGWLFLGEKERRLTLGGRVTMGLDGPLMTIHGTDNTSQRWITAGYLGLRICLSLKARDRKTSRE